MGEFDVKVEFPRVAGRDVAISFDGGEISSDAGLLLLAEADRRLGLTRRLAECLVDRRQPGKVQQSFHGRQSPLGRRPGLSAHPLPVREFGGEDPAAQDGGSNAGGVHPPSPPTSSSGDHPGRGRHRRPHPRPACRFWSMHRRTQERQPSPTPG